MRAFAVSTLIMLALAGCGPAETPPSSSAPPPAAAPSEDVAALQTAVAALPAPYNEADYEAGRRVFNQCRSCHTIEADGPNRIGPNLHGVFGRQAGSVEGFNYSEAVKGASFTWDAAQLDQWLQAPQSFLPGNRMAFAGVRDETQRRDLIAYIEVAGAR
jgi:cytochrome c